MIKIQNVSKRFGDYEAIKSVSLSVNHGEIYGVIGASGAGKSTLLRLMNLLESPDHGEVIVNDDSLTRLKGRRIREARQSIAMIFQQYNLLGNKTVYDNVGVPLELSKVPRQEREDRVMESLQFVGLDHFKDQYPAQLSGGQKQRVAIARALVNQPKVLLCDEPTSSLDPNTTAEILTVLKRINENFGVTIVIVSHEMEVIKSICERVTVMANGEVYETVEIEPAGIQKIDRSAQGFVERLTHGGDHHA
ncbi:D-methionine transport system ATP-binding protein [Alkalibacillus filiformis]|uniref:D-methionine transport system ATP-binding protein n=1 Tax=Alkalibacillus filiformis TaxID=200990 RepID=A0ABU0DSS6_9BACI|nr:methionine ABC transporter ATP-binding protein [Alkalibacillus filiformis]MDQ0351487.1 D-methionine transport system ATP-binding protein [Alkalibacillus filiformis]